MHEKKKKNVGLYKNNNICGFLNLLLHETYFYLTYECFGLLDKNMQIQ